MQRLSKPRLGMALAATVLLAMAWLSFPLRRDIAQTDPRRQYAQGGVTNDHEQRASHRLPSSRQPTQAPLLSVDEIRAKLRNFDDSSFVSQKEMREWLAPLDQEQLLALIRETQNWDHPAALRAISLPAIALLLERGTNAVDIHNLVDSADAPSWVRPIMLGAVAYAFEQAVSEDFSSFTSTFPSAEDQEKLRQFYYQSMASHSPETAITKFLAEKSPNSPYSNLATVVGGIREDADFSRIIRMIPSDSTPGANEVRSSILDKWAQNEPEQAVAYAFNSEQASPIQTAVAMTQWCSADPKKAVEWLFSQSSSEKTTAAVKKVIELRSSSDPEMSWSLAALIADPTDRERAYRAIYSKWQRFQPDQASAAMKRANLQP